VREYRVLGEGEEMRKILLSGIFACFLVGIVFFFFRFIIVDVLAPIFQPVVLKLTGQEYLVIPLALVFTFLIILVVGSIVTRIKFRDLYNRFIRRVPEDLQKGRGALVMFNPGAYYLAVIIKEVDLKKANGDMQRYYVLYCPSVPLPWSGLPLVYAEKERVTPLKLSYGELYSILGSFGTNTPACLTALKTDFPEADREPAI
jgi:uncharacterized membrane protein